MSGFSVRVEGLDNLLKKLEALEVKPAKVRKILLEGAKLISEEAKRLAPYDEKRDKGIHLRDAIFAMGKPRFSEDMSAIAAVSFKRAPHAHLVEYGTGPRPGTGQMPASPFWRPAIDNKKNEVVTNVVAGLKDLIEEAVKK